MLGKRSRPLIMKLSGSFQPSSSDSVNIAATTTAITSPRSPLDFQIPLSKTRGAPPAVKNKFNHNESIIKCSHDRVGFGVGLGLIIALEESNAAAGEKILVNYGIRTPSTPRSVPIPFNPSRYAGCGGGGGSYFRGESNLYYNETKVDEEEVEDEEEEEDYTLVTRRGCDGGDKPVTTRVYCDNDRRRKHDDCTFAMTTTMIRRRMPPKQDGGAVFRISSGFCDDDEEDEVESGSDFLSSCYLCSKTLIGKDIYMYRGEKAFCSGECRQRQMARDEKRKEKKFCRSNAAAAAAAGSTSLRSSSPPSSSSNVVVPSSRSPYRYEAMFTAGMVAV